jgi:hypothetical protein
MTRRPVVYRVPALALLPAIVGMLLSCDVPVTPFPPYRIMNPRLEDDGGTLRFSVVNTAAVPTAVLYIACVVSDNDGSAVAPSHTRLPATIPPEASAEIVVDLSEVSWHTLLSSRLVTQLHLYRVDYGDGTTWTDRLGLYALAGPIR